MFPFDSNLATHCKFLAFRMKSKTNRDEHYQQQSFFSIFAWLLSKQPAGSSSPLLRPKAPGFPSVYCQLFYCANDQKPIPAWAALKRMCRLSRKERSSGVFYWLNSLTLKQTDLCNVSIKHKANARATLSGYRLDQSDLWLEVYCTCHCVPLVDRVINTNTYYTVAPILVSTLNNKKVILYA